MTAEHLSALVKGIRVGSHRNEIDKLSGPSGGILNSESLAVQHDKKNWPHELAKPCSIKFDEDGRVFYVHFDKGIVEVPGLDPDAELDAVRRVFPDYGEVYRGTYARDLQIVSLKLGQDDNGAIAVCEFRNGIQAGICFWAPDRLQALEEDNRAYDVRLEREEAEKATKDAQAAAEREAHSEWRRTAHPDDVLRNWAKSHSAWGESTEVWVRFVDWLIDESSPVDRQLVLLAYNRDHGIEVPNWIIRQPNTQLATVLSVFWESEPSYFVSSVARNESIPQHQEYEYEMLLQIGQNIARKFYKKPLPWRRIAFQPPARVTWDVSNPDVLKAVKLLIPEQAMVPIRGKKASELSAARELPFDPGILT